MPGRSKRIVKDKSGARAKIKKAPKILNPNTRRQLEQLDPNHGGVPPRKRRK